MKSRHFIVRASLACLVLGSITILTGSLCRAQAPVQNAAAKECLRIEAQSADSIPWGEHERVYKQWAETCRQALASDGNNLRIKRVLGRALMASGQREEAVKIWRELSAQNDADATFEIYDMYKSYFRSDINEPQLVKRAEAEQALRKAAELGHAYAILMLAVLLDRGDTVKRDNADAIHWAERAVVHPSKDLRPADMEVLLGRLLVKSDKPDQKARGIALLEKLAQGGRSDAKTQLAIATRSSDPVRARALFEQGLKGYPGGAISPLADMLLKGEGGPADAKRAVSLLSGGRASDVPGVKGALGMLYIEGKYVPRDLKKGIDLFRTWASWDYDARLQLMKLLADNPELNINYPGGFLYDVTEAAELGEPGALDALINLKLSNSTQFRDKPGGCKLIEEAAKRGDNIAARQLAECRSSTQ